MNEDILLLGAHISTAGGVPASPGRAKAVGATAMQIFTKMANQWRERECEAEECSAFREGVADTDVRVISAHDSYLINLASPKDDLRARSLESFTAELRRCNALGLHYLVSHPGNYMDDRDSGIARNADSISAGLVAAPGDTMLLLETTAGSGTALGATFDELAVIIARVAPEVRGRVGVCVDTCHVYAAGYDVVTDYDGVMSRLDDVIGIERVRMMHLNDSKNGLGTRKDRHALIAEGALGEEPFRRLMNDPRLRGVAKVIETPKGNDAEATDRSMLERLRSYME
ncbi:MAG: deoxyribonuclease IV [Gemmatimonadota bacterium]|nr:deoxyribonuclease IV [Gemmatimonadota bacterium]